MASQKRDGKSANQAASERTPLLRHNHSYAEPHEQAIAEDDDVQQASMGAAAPGLAPAPAPATIPFLPRYRRGSSGSHWMATEAEEDVEPDSEPPGPDPHPESHFLGSYTKTRFWTIYLGVLMGYFVATFDSTLMASSHPVITSYFHASNSASWLSTAFMLTCTAFQPLFGRMSDTFGRRPLYLFALIMFVGTTAWCALAGSIGSFIAARAFCGLGAGGVMAMVRCFIPR
jgi:Major Facilitator Superfamily